MNTELDIRTLLDQLSSPGFCVCGGKITAANPAAEALFLAPGDPLEPLILHGTAEYAAFEAGAIFLTLSIAGIPRGAAVTRMETCDLFLLETIENEEAFRSMALISRELRKPLTNVMACADALQDSLELSNPKDLDRMAKLNRSLMQMLRLVCNLSDVQQYASLGGDPQIQDICAFVSEITEKARTLTQDLRIRLECHLPDDPIFCPVDTEQLERAIWNLLSNALKFTPSGGTVSITLRQQGKRILLSVRDSGSGIAREILSTLFRRYQRQSAIEDNRFGIGLGMVIVRTAAANHGGTVLVEQNADGGSRITMTLALTERSDSMLRSPVFRPDYTGGWDHGLVELSELLDPHWYQD